jgi:hypothetical protein
MSTGAVTDVGDDDDDVHLCTPPCVLYCGSSESKWIDREATTRSFPSSTVAFKDLTTMQSNPNHNAKQS